MDEQHRRFHSGRYTDRPEATEWKLRDSYREARENNTEDAKRKAKVYKPLEILDDMVKTGKQEYKRKDM